MHDDMDMGDSKVVEKWIVVKVRPLTLHPTHADSLDKGLLSNRKHGNHRDGHEGCGGHHEVPLRLMSSLEGLQS